MLQISTLYHSYMHSVLVSVSQDGQTALIHAAREGCTETVVILLGAGADLNIQEVNKPNYAYNPV